MKTTGWNLESRQVRTVVCGRAPAGGLTANSWEEQRDDEEQRDEEQGEGGEAPPLVPPGDQQLYPGTEEQEDLRRRTHHLPPNLNSRQFPSPALPRT